MIHGYDDSNKAKVEVLSKEQLYAVLNELIQGGELPSVDEDTAFVTMLKSIVDGGTYKIGFCTEAQYNQMEQGGTLETNAYYIITDDDSYAELLNLINAVALRVDTLEGDVSDLNDVVLKTKTQGAVTYTSKIENSGDSIIISLVDSSDGGTTAFALSNGDIQLLFKNVQYSLKNRLAKTLKLKTVLKALNSLTQADVQKYTRVERQIGDSFYPCQLIWDESQPGADCYYFNGSSWTKITDYTTNIICYYYNYE